MSCEGGFLVLGMKRPCDGNGDAGMCGYGMAVKATGYAGMECQEKYGKVRRGREENVYVLERKITHFLHTYSLFIQVSSVNLAHKAS